MKIKLTEPLLDTFKPFIKSFYRKCDYVRIKVGIDYISEGNPDERTYVWFECRKRLNTPDSILVIEKKILIAIDAFRANEVWLIAFVNSHMRTKTEFKRLIYRKE